MPFEARDTLRLQLAGKIDQWFAKTDGSGAVFLMNVTDPAEARARLCSLHGKRRKRRTPHARESRLRLSGDALPHD
jgi:hypothetical protein